MTEEKPEQAPAETEPPKYFVKFRGQDIEIGASDPTQLAMMRLTASRMSRLNPDSTSAEEAIRVFEKVIQIVTSIVVSRDDRDWIEDLLISKEMDLEEATEFMNQASVEWSKDSNRADRRAKKTARKKAAAGKK